jgi:hypothetical protein
MFLNFDSKCGYGGQKYNVTGHVQGQRLGPVLQNPHKHVVHMGSPHFSRSPHTDLPLPARDFSSVNQYSTGGRVE